MVRGGEDHLYNPCFMHCDAVIRILGQLMKSTSSGAMDVGVVGTQVADQRSHCIGLTKCITVVTPHATPTQRINRNFHYCMYLITASEWNSEYFLVFEGGIVL